VLAVEGGLPGAYQLLFDGFELRFAGDCRVQGFDADGGEGVNGERGGGLGLGRSAVMGVEHGECLRERAGRWPISTAGACTCGRAHTTSHAALAHHRTSSSPLACSSASSRSLEGSR